MKKSLGAETLAFPTPVYIVGTYNEEGIPNAMNVAWAGVCSSVPPCMMIAVRKSRYTYDNIMKTGEFTINIPDVDHVKEADYFGLVSGKAGNKFETEGLNLTVKKAENVNAPVIEEFPMALECKCIETVDVGEHHVIVGEIINVAVEESCLDEKGKIDITKVKPMAYDPAANSYNAIGDKVADAFSVGLPLLNK